MVSCSVAGCDKVAASYLEWEFFHILHIPLCPVHLKKFEKDVFTRGSVYSIADNSPVLTRARKELRKRVISTYERRNMQKQIVGGKHGTD